MCNIIEFRGRGKCEQETLISFHSTVAKFKCFATLAESSMAQIVSDAKTLIDISLRVNYVSKHLKLKCPRKRVY